MAIVVRPGQAFAPLSTVGRASTCPPVHVGPNREMLWQGLIVVDIIGGIRSRAVA